MKGITLVIGIILGISIGAAGMYFVNINHTSTTLSATGDQEEQPLYWVAPMDPNYRRDGPGKSPMGMDLVPVYAKDESAGDSAGTVKISPEVINNLSVRTASAEKKPLNTTIRTVGYLQYDQDRLVHVHPRVEGWVEMAAVSSVGATVKKGQKLYSLYSPALVNAQEEYLFGLKRGDERMIAAAEQRLRALQFPSSAINQLKRQRKALQSIDFYAPASGVVESINLREGLFVKPGETLVSIADLSEVWLEAEILERQANLIAVGMPAQVRLDALPGQTLSAAIDYIYPSLDPNTRTLRVRIRLSNPEQRLKPNMYAELEIVAADTQQRLLVPKEAVIRTGSRSRVVLALGEGRFKSINVKTGSQDSQWIEVVEGLVGGDEVVTSAQFLLDSESSKTSDFARMESTAEKPATKPKQVWVEIKVNSVNADSQTVNVDHAAIEDWMWPEMTMDFQLDPPINSEQLSPGLIAHAQITRTDNNRYAITGLHIPEESNLEPPSEKPSEKMQQKSADSEPVEKVWVKARVLAVDAAALIIDTEHEAIPAWGWPAMTMTFDVESWVELSDIPLNTPLHLEVTRQNKTDVVVTDFYLADQP